ncbi:alpha/beta-hydrolase [Durotheca rogersii]|uniref:alpha/beta-hydrolase n=1 Tax=Durotheca rogersii TaxID=419775 RepID=UPI0022207C5C|nr:alpha/beta-hydrolase [Durotheca rogersii]KAI5865601.1 alpha/beta-hydrolase [Durotheca rogersii]
MRLNHVFVALAAWSLGAGALPNPSPVSAKKEALDSRDLLPFDTAIPDALRLSELYGAPDNDFGCRGERNPVVLLHGLSASRDVDLNMLQRELSRRGYCTFSLTYGAWPLLPWVGGLRPMAESARDIAAFVRAVSDRTGAPRVDLVGHSEGGVQALYVPLTQAGLAGVVERVVALGPAVHGARYFGFTDLLYLGGEVTRRVGRAVQTLLGCPACDDMMTGGAVYRSFRDAARIVQPGTRATIIMSRSDTLVSPEVSRVDEEGVRNVIVQDTCPEDPVGHAGLMWDKSVWRLVVNALEENDDAVFACEKGLPV